MEFEAGFAPSSSPLQFTFFYSFGKFFNTLGGGPYGSPPIFYYSAPKS